MLYAIHIFRCAADAITRYATPPCLLFHAFMLLVDFHAADIAMPDYAA